VQRNGYARNFISDGYETFKRFEVLSVGAINFIPNIAANAFNLRQYEIHSTCDFSSFSYSWTDFKRSGTITNTLSGRCPRWGWTTID
jgi:hypothetical protein